MLNGRPSPNPSSPAPVAVLVDNSLQIDLPPPQDVWAGHPRGGAAAHNRPYVRSHHRPDYLGPSKGLAGRCRTGAEPARLRAWHTHPFQMLPRDLLARSSRLAFCAHSNFALSQPDMGNLASNCLRRSS